MTMANYAYPGVYIEEIATNGPIAGAGTSTVAFLGPAKQGPLFTPMKITSWGQFKQQFGDYIIGPPQYFTAYAVKGFFDNGGTTAYFVRVGTQKPPSLDLKDRGSTPSPTLHVEGKQGGKTGGAITVAVDNAQLVTTQAYRADVAIKSAKDKTITLASSSDASKFQPGDAVTIDGTQERAIIGQISGPELQLETGLAAPHDSGTVRIADLAAGQSSFRIDGDRSSVGLDPGSVITIAQDTTTEKHVVSAVNGRVITLDGALTNAFTLAAADHAVTIVSSEFTLTITGPQSGDKPEQFTELSMDRRHRRYWRSVVRSDYVDVTPASVPSTQTPPNNQPATMAATSLNPGDDDDLTALGKEHYEQGLDALVAVQDVQLVCVPDSTNEGVQVAVLDHCELMGDRFAILDAKPGLKPDSTATSDLMLQRTSLSSDKGYASLYYPWLLISDPNSVTGEPLAVPPSGHLAGVYARVDAQRGVHKAPANEVIAGTVGVETIVDNATQGGLNLEGINVLRVFPGEGRPIVWGARTTAPRDTTWIHNSVRRLFIFIETSLKLGLRPWVFEPNDTTLWKKLERTITEFLTRVWRSGALFGNKASEAFYVKIDEELNPPSQRALGQVFIEIGLAPVHPAEFVVVRIGIWEGGSSATET